MKKLTCIFILMIVTVSLFAAGGSAQRSDADFPTRQVRIIVQAAAGGSSDLISRTIAPGVEAALGVPVVVENRTGGGGAVGLSYGAAQPPDGYVINYLPPEILMLQPAGSASVTPADFAPVVRVMQSGAVLAVRADSRYRNLNDFIADARARPGEVTMGHSGFGAIWHLGAVQLENAAGIRLSQIPFDGSAPSMTALLGGHVDAIICSITESVPHVQGGAFRLLGIFFPERNPMLPDIPTMREQGIDVIWTTYMGFGVPRGTPPHVVRILRDAFRAGYDSAPFQEMIVNRAYVPGWMETDEYTRLLRDDFEVYSRLIPAILGN